MNHHTTIDWDNIPALMRSIVDSTHVYASLFPIDSCFFIGSAKGQIIGYVPAKTFHIKGELGVMANPNSVMERVVKSKKDQVQIRSKEHYGFPVKSVGKPIFENGVFIGAIVIIMTLEVQDTLHTSSQAISNGTEKTTAMMQELASSARILTQNIELLREKGERVIQETQHTDGILSFVSSVSQNSNLLGLNASIEAARAGEYGRGFAVVAQEIRKMADESATAVKNIKETLITIRQEVSEIMVSIDEVSRLGNQQLEASEEVAVDMESLIYTAREIEALANRL